MELDLTGLQMPNLPEQPAEGQIVLRPLERGFGHTLGNTMRRSAWLYSLHDCWRDML